MILPFDPVQIAEDKGIDIAAQMWRTYEFIETLRNLRRVIGLLSEAGLLIMSRTAVKTLPSTLKFHRPLLVEKDFEATELREINEVIDEILRGDRFSGLVSPLDRVSHLVDIMNDRIRTFSRKSKTS